MNLQPNFLLKTNFKSVFIISCVWVLIIFYFTQTNSNELIPKPLGVLSALSTLVKAPNFLDDIMSTISLILKGMLMSIGVSLFFIYLKFLTITFKFKGKEYVLPIFKDLATIISKMRFLTYTGLIFVFTILLHNGHDIKLALLLLGIVPYFTTTFLSYLGEIPEKEFILCYTLKFSHWKTMYETVILGRLHVLLEVIRQNFAIAFAFITTAEGYCMSEGGIGTMMIKSNRVQHIDEIFAVLLIVFTFGLLFDYLFNTLKIWAFPYTSTEKNSKLLVNKLFKK